MPIFEFKCESCGKEFEEMTGRDEAAPPCPDCGGHARKLMSACRRMRGSGSGGDYAPSSSGGGCGGCMGGNCASCGR